MSNRYLYITLLSLLGLSQEACAQALAQSPRLVVNITVDHLRTDYLETYTPLYGPDGLQRLLQQGVVYTNGSYGFSPVDRASAAAALSTGTSPYYNGIAAMEWLDRETLRPQYCVRDAQQTVSPVHLATSTLGDELKIATSGVARVFSFAPTAECAILSAGHAADGAAWIAQGRWSTTSYYAPVNQWLNGFARLEVPAADGNMSVVAAALKCVEQAGIALDEKTDMLCLTLSTNSLMEDYVALDRAVAHLIQGVEGSVPRDRVLFVLSGTGSSEEREEEVNGRFRIPTGTFYINRTANLLNMYLGAVFGMDRYVEACYKNHIFLNHKTIRQKNLNLGDVQRRSQEFLLQIAGVRNVYTSNQLMTSDSYQLERIRNGFNVEKSGDLIVGVAPGWKLVNEDTHEQVLSRAANIPFPIIFYGAGLKAQRLPQTVTADRIAPTVARLIRIRAPNACSSEPLF